MEFLAKGRTVTAGELRNVPLTDAQREIWLATQMGPAASAAHTESCMVHLDGWLDLTAMEQAIETVVNRHEALRATFSPRGDYQQFSPSAAVEAPFLDLSKLERTERDAQLNNLLAEEGPKSFDLVNGPLFSFRIIRIEKDRHLLVFTVHHIACDSWSRDIVLRELGSLYSSNVKRERGSLPRPMQFREHARWEEEQKQSPEAAATEKFWLSQFSGLLPVLDMPGDHHRPPTRSYKSRHHEHIISKQSGAEIKRIAAKNSSTLFAILFAAYEVLLYRWTGQEDLIIGIPAAGQNRVGSDDLVGHCENLLPIRSRLNGSQRFVDFLQSVTRTLLYASEHQGYTFGSLIRKLNLPRDSRRGPLVAATFNLHPPLSGLDFAGLKFKISVNPRSHNNFDLDLNIVDQDSELRLECDYNADLFEAPTIQRLLGHYQTLLEGIVADPLRPVSSLPLLTENERKQLVVEWNDTASDIPWGACVHHLFEAQAEQTPTAVAVAHEDKRLTYSQLNHRSNQLARRLRRLGVGPDVLVGVYMERSLDAVVGLLAVLKAGGAYVPLDPAYPDERLRFVLEDANIQLLLTQQCLLPRLAGRGSRIMTLDLEWESISQESGGNPFSMVTPGHLAYVIYTSGSTGKPKGVMIPHAAFLNYVVTSSRDYELGPGDHVLQFASLSFDSSVEEIFSCLVSGARLVLRTDRMLESASVFLTRCEDWDITVLSLPTAYWHELTAALDAEALRVPESLRVVIIGGERALADRLSLWQKHVPKNVRLINSYGPTETTVGATAADLSSTPTNDVAHEVLIGRPISNAQTYVLDRIGQPVLIGVAGELYIGGVGLARGYLNSPEVTAERFLPNPFSNDHGARVYKTGDLVRYSPNGNLECLGRVDDQVKIRGFRIELGEIEAVLSQCQGVNQAIVLVHEASPGDKRLVAYVVRDNAHELSIPELRKFLKGQLPDYMVPSYFVTLAEFPITPSGKVDRKALPIPDISAIHPDNGYVPPRNKLEVQLTKIWESILGVGRVGVNDNFFDLGGHSLLVPRLHAQIQKSLKKTIPLSLLFQAPTVAGIAHFLRNGHHYHQWASLVPVQTKGNYPPFFCVHGYAGYPQLARYLGDEQPFYGLVQGLDGKKFYTRVEDVAAAYLRELRVIQPEGPYFLGGHSFGGMVAFEMAQQLGRCGEKVALLALMDTEQPSGGPKLSPQTTPTRTRAIPKVSMLCEKVLRHSETFRRLGGAQERAKHIRNLIKLTKKRISRATQRAVCETYLALKQPLPPRLRTFYINEILFGELYESSAKDYCPGEYRGDVVFFRAATSADASECFWRTLVAGRFAVFKVPGNHLAMLQEPDVQSLAEHLKNFLAAARSHCLWLTWMNHEGHWILELSPVVWMG